MQEGHDISVYCVRSSLPRATRETLNMHRSKKHEIFFVSGECRQYVRGSRNKK